MCAGTFSYDQDKQRVVLSTQSLTGTFEVKCQDRLLWSDYVYVYISYKITLRVVLSKCFVLSSMRCAAIAKRSNVMQTNCFTFCA